MPQVGCSVRCPQRTFQRVRRYAPRTAHTTALVHRYVTDTLYCPMFLTHLECSACALEHPWSHLQNLCFPSHKPLFAIVDLAAASRPLKRETLPRREKTLWRYREVLPLPRNV